jgi:hypothetical protein
MLGDLLGRPPGNRTPDVIQAEAQHTMADPDEGDFAFSYPAFDGSGANAQIGGDNLFINQWRFVRGILHLLAICQRWNFL